MVEIKNKITLKVKKENQKTEEISSWMRIEEDSYLKKMEFIVWAPLTNAVAIFFSQ